MEEAESDVLVLLDCCASGVANTNSGNQANELIAACAFNSRANGVGPFSFTNALVIELRDLSSRPSFTVGELYSNIFSRTQSRMPEDGVERHPAPVHLVLTHERPLLRSIQLSVLRFVEHNSKIAQAHLVGQGEFMMEDIDESQRGHKSSQHMSRMNSAASLSLEKVPRLAFAIRLKDTVKASELSADLFIDWLRCIPAAAEEVKIEAGFDSLSTLLIVSMPMLLASYLPSDPAITCLGPVTSTNHLIEKSQKEQIRTLEEYLLAEKQLTATLEEALAMAELEAKNAKVKEKCDACKQRARLGTSSTITNQQHEDLIARVRDAGQYLLSLADGTTGSKLEPQPLFNHPVARSSFMNLNSGPPSVTFPPTPAMSVASRPTSLDTALPIQPGSSTSQQLASETDEAKRKRRRESHNLVERRRRDQINEMILELAHLVPHHRLHKTRYVFSKFGTFLLISCCVFTISQQVVHHFGQIIAKLSIN